MKLDLKNIAQIYPLLVQPILKDKRFFLLSVSYTCLIAVLYLALPLSIETLISSITSTASLQPIIIVSIILFFLLVLSGILTLLQKYLVEIYYRASFVRLTSDFFLKVVYSNKKLFDKLNTSDLNGRYFEIFNIQKSVSVLLIEGLLILLQLLVSVVLVSFYHPYLFLLNVICIGILTLCWRLFFSRAIQSAINKSHAKFHVFSWLHDVFRMNGLFKSTTNKNFALNKAKNLMDNYVQRSKQYWSIILKQNILLIILYLFMTMALFSMGGFLVIKGQLSLGQLVAAEIIFTGVLYSISKLGYYFDLFYNLVASAEELVDVFAIEEEPLSEFVSSEKTQGPILTFKDVSFDDKKGNLAKFNFNIQRNSAYLLVFETQYLREIFLDLMQNHIEPEHGLIQLNQVNLSLYNQHYARDKLYIIDNSEIFSCTIKEFLWMQDNEHYQNYDHEFLQMILDLVGLDKIIAQYSEELNTAIIGTGYPLESFEIVLLKLARALILKPKILIITEILDIIPPEIYARVMAYIIEKKEMTLLHFSKQVASEFVYDTYLYSSRATHLESENKAEFLQMLAALRGNIL